MLFAGTERSLFVTHDSGAHWAKLAANLPTTRYDDILIHPRTKDLVLGTHGRSIWVLDDASPIGEWTAAIAAKRAHLFAVPRATLMLYWEDVSNMDHYFFTAENPAEGAAFTYHLAQPAQKVRLLVTAPPASWCARWRAPEQPAWFSASRGTCASRFRRLPVE